MCLWQTSCSFKALRNSRSWNASQSLFGLLILMAKWSVVLFGGAASAREVQTEGFSLARTTVLFTPEAWGIGVVAKGGELWTTAYLP